MGPASQELTERAKLLIAERKYQEAVRACRRALLSQPDQVEVRLLLGEALLALDRYDEVRVEMMALARKLPSRVEVHRLLGEAYLRDGRPKQAVESLRKALELDPHDAAARELLLEADDETAPISSTIERWFADEAVPTVETESPPWEETKTPVPATAGDTSGPPSVEIDPSLITERLPLMPQATKAQGPLMPQATKAQGPLMPQATKVQGPRVRSRQPTLAGGVDAAPFPAPPSRGAAPFAQPLVSPFPTVPPPQAPAPQPPARASYAPAGLADSTAAHRPSALRAPEPEAAPQALVSEDLELESVSEERILEEDFESLDAVPEELSGAPTRAHVPVPSFDDDPATYVRPPSATPGFAGPPVAAPVFAGPPASAPAPSPFVALPAAPAPFVAPAASAPSPFVPPAPSPSPSVAPAEPPVPAAPPQAYPVAKEPPPRAPSKAPRPSNDAGTARVRPSKRWIVPAAIGAAVLLLLCVGGGFGISAWQSASAREAIRAAARTAGDSGLRAELEAAVRQIDEEGTDDPELAALEARLLATLALEHGQDRRAAAEVLLAQIAAEPHTDAAIASALLDLARGDAQSALQRLSGLTAEGEQIAEAFHARALATAALGRLSEAEESARQAAMLRPAAPRHAALHALMRHRIGDSAGALAMLDAVPGGAQAAAVRVARARILDESGSDPVRAHDEASAVIGELAERASPSELAWAHLLLAKHAVTRGDTAAALSEARAAAERTPPLDEAFGMQLVNTLLRAGAAGEARTALARLPETPADAPARALLSAEVALANGDLDGADAALGRASAGPRRSLLLAEVLEARGRPDTARPLYEEAMRAPGPEGRRARVRLAAIAMRGGQAERAITLLEPGLAAAPDDAELVPLLARAYLAEDRADDAQRVIDAALARRPSAPELLAARGALELRRGRLPEALAALRSAVEARPEDADLQADLGEAARRAGELDAARAAFDAALARRADHPGALIGHARLALAAGELEQAEQRLDAAARTGREGLEVARLRGELLVMRGDGALGAAVMAPLARTHDDARVWAALGHLQAQAEADREASRSYDRALRRARNDPEVRLGESLIAVRRGDLGGARRAIESAQEHAGTPSPQLRARLAVARGRLEFENGDFDDVVRLANEAITLDARNASAHLLLANVAIERGDSPVEHLRRAVAGNAPPPEALGRLASRLGRGEEACRLATRYLQVAPRGYDAGEVRDVAGRCR